MIYMWFAAKKINRNNNNNSSKSKFLINLRILINKKIKIQMHTVLHLKMPKTTNIILMKI